ncbi:MAG: hypothetical protein ACN6O3_21210, partial [Comamonas sp.]
MFYAQLQDNICVGISQLTGPAEHPDLVEIAAYDETLLGKVYDPATGEFSSPPPAPQTEPKASKLAFRNRFTQTEKVAIEIAAIDDASAAMAQRQAAAALRAYLADVAAATFIDLQRPDTRAGVQQLETLGLLAAGRAAVILDT